MCFFAVRASRTRVRTVAPCPSRLRLLHHSPTRAASRAHVTVSMTANDRVVVDVAVLEAAVGAEDEADTMERNPMEVRRVGWMHAPACTTTLGLLLLSDVVSDLNLLPLCFALRVLCSVHRNFDRKQGEHHKHAPGEA